MRLYGKVALSGDYWWMETEPHVRLRFKRLSSLEVDAYLASGEWRGKAGGYAIQGLAGSFVVKLVGSYTAVVGLPLYETVSLLAGEGYPVLQPWFAKA